MRKFWLCLSLLLAGSLPSAHARGFIAPSTFPLGKSPGGSPLADMNNDGILDLVNTFDSGSSGFSFDVSLGNGDGTFRPPIVTGEILGRSRGGFTVGDMNGDGNIDVLAYVEDGFAFILLGVAPATSRTPSPEGCWAFTLFHVIGGLQWRWQTRLCGDLR